MTTTSRAASAFRLEAAIRTRLWSVIAAGIAEHGQAGNVLSGGAYPQWPSSLRQRVRRLNAAMNRACAAGFAARPPYARMHTMRQLRLDTITNFVANNRSN